MDQPGISLLGGGSTSPAWIQNLLDCRFNGPRSILDTGVITASLTRSRCDTAHHRHTLLLLHSQSSYTNESVPAIFHGVCAYCDYHFIIRSSPDNSYTQCKEHGDISTTTDESAPFHHLVWTSSASLNDIISARGKHYPLATRATFLCSVCRFKVDLEISEPRLSIDDRRFMEGFDQPRVDNIESSDESSPNRAGSLQIATHVRAILNGHLDPSLKYELALDDGFHTWFNSLLARYGFTFGSQVMGDILMPTVHPVLTPNESGDFTVVGSPRAVIEDILAEVENILLRDDPSAVPTAYAYESLQKMLGCYDFHCNELTGCPLYPTLGDTALNYEEPHDFIILGAMSAYCERYVRYSYQRQIAVWGSAGRSMLLHSLKAVLTCNTTWDGLAELVAIDGSILDQNPSYRGPLSPTLRSALEAFQLHGPIPTRDAIINAFYDKLVATPNQVCQLTTLVDTLCFEAGSQEALYSRLERKIVLPKPVAMNILKIGAKDGPALIIERANTMIFENPANSSLHSLVRACVFALGYYFRSDGDISSSDALQSFDFYSVAAAATGGIRTPVGLFNIGNTCYLNSILQLLFSCSVIHEILMDHHATYLSLTNHDLSNRRIGGNCIPLDRCEGIIGQVFFSELHALFSRLKAAEDGIAIKPSQLLANSALISTTQLLKSSKSRQDLGTCPDGSLSSHTPYSHRIVSANLPADPQTIPPQPLSPDESYGPPPGQGQVASSCQTDRLSDLSTTEAEATLKMCLNNHSRTSGTEQQDFEEVHGRILNLIQASIAPLRTTDGVQWDSIMDTFYVEVANYTANNTGLVNTEVVLDRYITAFPAKSESCTLYQALDRNFDRHGIEGSQSIRWSSIRQPSPMLNILIQRSQAGGMKNMNEVAIPDVLDISRYMDLPPRRNRPGPDGWNVLPARYRAWCINSRVERLQQIKAAFAAPVTAVSQAYVASHLNILESVGDTSPAFVPHHSSMASLMSTRLFEVDGVHDSQSPTLSEVFIETQKDDMRRPSVVTSSDMPSFALPAINVVAPQVDNTIEALITSKESLLGSVSKVDAFDVSDTLFHLHAVICHSGGMNAGHYWIWIKDHDRNVWRKYNDAHVTEHSAEEALGSLGGDPCYLCFVRARDRERFVYTSP